MARGQVNEYGMTFHEWMDGAHFGARWSYGKHSRRLRRAWAAGECFADYALLFSSLENKE